MKLTGNTSSAMSSTIAFASAKAISQLRSPFRPCESDLNCTTLKDQHHQPPQTFADMPAPALVPVIGIPVLGLVLCKVTVVKIVVNWLALSPP